MKHRSALAAFILSLCIIPAAAQTIDIKAHVADTTAVLPLKLSLDYYLTEAGYRVFDFGEDYALWIEDFRKTLMTDGTIYVSTRLVLARPSLFSRGAIIAERSYSYSYNPGAPEKLDADDGLAKYLAAKGKRLTDEARLEAGVAGPGAAEIVIALLGEAGVR